MSAGQKQQSPLANFAIVLAILSFILAGILAFGQQTVRIGERSEAPNVAAAGGACGFAIAGGLCIVGAAIAETRNRSKSVDDRNP